MVIPAQNVKIFQNPSKLDFGNLDVNVESSMLIVITKLHSQLICLRLCKVMAGVLGLIGSNIKQ